MTDDLALEWMRVPSPKDRSSEVVRVGNEMAMTLNLRPDDEKETCRRVIDRVAVRLRKFGPIQAGQLWDRLVKENGWRLTHEQAQKHLLREDNDEGDEESICQLCGIVIGRCKWIVCLQCYERVTGCNDEQAPEQPER